MGRHPLDIPHERYIDPRLEDGELLGACAVCGEHQYQTPGGPSCKNGHGGADTVALAGSMVKPADPANPYPKMSEGTTVEVRMAPAFERILEHTFKVDPWKDYSALEDALRIGERGYTDHDTLMAALNDAEDNARRAHQLYCAARVEQERWELDAQVVEGAARRKVLRDLEAEKEAGQRKKQITEADVAGYIQLQYPDEYDRLRLTRLKLRKLVEHMERLAELWAGRCRTLQAMLAKSR